jgi:hypothetical protein
LLEHLASKTDCQYLETSIDLVVMQRNKYIWKYQVYAQISPSGSAIALTKKSNPQCISHTSPLDIATQPPLKKSN